MIVSKYVVSVEIKTTRRHLEVFHRQVPWSDEALLHRHAQAPAAFLDQPVSRTSPEEVIGIIDSDAGKVVVLPQVQDFQK